MLLTSTLIAIWSFSSLVFAAAKCFTLFTVTTSYPETRTKYKALSPVTTLIECKGCRIGFATKVIGQSFAAKATTTISTTYETVVPMCQEDYPAAKATATPTTEQMVGVDVAVEPTKAAKGDFLALAGLLKGAGAKGKEDGGLLGLPGPGKLTKELGLGGGDGSKSKKEGGFLGLGGGDASGSKKEGGFLGLGGGDGAKSKKEGGFLGLGLPL